MLTTGFQSFAKKMNKKSFVVAAAMVLMLHTSAEASCLSQVKRHKPSILNTGKDRMATIHQEAQWDKGVQVYEMSVDVSTPTKWNYKEVCSVVDINVRNWMDNFNDLCNDLNANTIPRGEIIRDAIKECDISPHSKSCKAKGTKKFIKRLSAMHKNVLGEQQLLALWRTTCDPMQCFTTSMDDVAQQLGLDYKDANSFIGRLFRAWFGGAHHHHARWGNALKMSKLVDDMKSLMDEVRVNEKELQKWLNLILQKSEVLVELNGGFSGAIDSVENDETAEEFWEEVDTNKYYFAMSNSLKQLVKLGSDPLCKRYQEMHIGGHIYKGGM